MKVINKYLITEPNKKLLSNEKTERYADAIFGLQRIGGFGGKVISLQLSNLFWRS